MSLTPAQVRRIVLSFDGVEEKRALGGGAAFHVEGAFLVQIGTREPDTLMLKTETLDERDLMIESDPDMFFITDHFRGYRGLLARISALDATTLRALLKQRLKFIRVKTKKRR
jgi:hypothetical protein